MATGTNQMNTEILTDAKRLAYIFPHAQRPCGGGSRTEGRPCSDEKGDSRRKDRTSPPGSQRPVGGKEGKKRVTERRKDMTPSSFQEGYVFFRPTEHGKV